MSNNEIAPNKAAILNHLNFLFKDCKEYRDGRIEISYTPSDSGAVNKTEWFDVTDLEGAADCAVRLNSKQVQST